MINTNIIIIIGDTSPAYRTPSSSNTKRGHERRQGKLQQLTSRSF